MFGAMIAEQDINGFIDLPSGSKFGLAIDGRAAIIKVVEHIRPLMVTDFANSITQTVIKKNLIVPKLKKPIGPIQKECIALVAAGHEGRKAPTIVVEKGAKGRVFRQGIFTRLRVCWEIEEKEIDNLTIYHAILTNFFDLYRYVVPDPRFQSDGTFITDETPLRVATARYAKGSESVSQFERLDSIPTLPLEVKIVSFRKAADALQDHVNGAVGANTRASSLGSLMRRDFTPSENFVALDRVARFAFHTSQYRMAVAEAMAVLEAALLGFKADADVDAANKEMTWKKLINAVLPSILSEFDGDKAELMRAANKSRSIRNDVVHHRYLPSKEETFYVINFVKTILHILETPEDIKGDWRRL